MQITSLHIIGGGLAGTACLMAGAVLGPALTDRPAYTLGSAVGHIAIVCIANALFGLTGFYASLAILALTNASKAISYAREWYSLQQEVRFKQVARRLLQA